MTLPSTPFCRTDDVFRILYEVFGMGPDLAFPRFARFLQTWWPGSGLTFEPAGERELTRVPDRGPLLRVTP